ncbi:hypothetical protein [Polycladospora coralii]|nr:hypothetical protein [Polycladospora coralii]
MMHENKATNDLVDFALGFVNGFILSLPFWGILYWCIRMMI